MSRILPKVGIIIYCAPEMVACIVDIGMQVSVIGKIVKRMIIESDKRIQSVGVRNHLSECNHQYC